MGIMGVCIMNETTMGFRDGGEMEGAANWSQYLLYTAFPWYIRASSSRQLL